MAGSVFPLIDTLKIIAEYKVQNGYLHTFTVLKSRIYSFKYDFHLKNTEVNNNPHDKQTILIQVEFVVELFTFTRV